MVTPTSLPLPSQKMLSAKAEQPMLIFDMDDTWKYFVPHLPKETFLLDLPIKLYDLVFMVRDGNPYTFPRLKK
jgi:hypothetical protein